MREGALVAGRYRLLHRIGAGAMGTVWAARHELLDRELALKICAFGDGKHASADKRALFLREVRIVGRLRHPNVVEIADAGDAGPDGLYLAMELLQGESLAQRVAQGPVPAAEALAIAAEVCRGLVAAHRAGVVHRDLKPENIFLARGPAGSVVPKLLDFGVSSARDMVTLRRAEAFGTPAYMSPEQALGEGGVDHRTDVWAMGIVLYEMLTGRLPFEASSYVALLPLIIEAPAPPLPPSIPAEACAVVAGCLAKSRDDRYPTATALLDAIDRALEALGGAPEDVGHHHRPPAPSSTRTGFFVETAAPPPPLPDRTHAPRWGLALALLAVPVAIGVAAIVARGPGRTQDAPKPAAALAQTNLATATPTPVIVASASATTGVPPITMGDPQRVPPITMGDPQRVPQTPPVSPPALSASVARTPLRAAPVAASAAPRVGPKKLTRVDNAGF